MIQLEAQFSYLKVKEIFTISRGCKRKKKFSTAATRPLRRHVVRKSTDGKKHAASSGGSSQSINLVPEHQDKVCFILVTTKKQKQRFEHSDT